MTKLSNTIRSNMFTKKTGGKISNTRFRSSTKNDENNDEARLSRGEAEKGGDYVFTSSNRTSLGTIDANNRRITRSNSQT